MEEITHLVELMIKNQSRLIEIIEDINSHAIKTNGKLTESRESVAHTRSIAKQLRNTSNKLNKMKTLIKKIKDNE